MSDCRSIGGSVYSVGNGVGVCNGSDAKEFKPVFSTRCEKADNVYYHSGNKMVYVQHGPRVSVVR